MNFIESGQLNTEWLSQEPKKPEVVEMPEWMEGMPENLNFIDPGNPDTSEWIGWARKDPVWNKIRESFWVGVKPRKVIGVFGPSGSGKSTLVRGLEKCLGNKVAHLDYDAYFGGNACK